MQLKPLVSVIIPLYNRAHTISDCLASCINQSYKNIEIIVVDDCSSDHSREIVREMAEKDPRIQLFLNEKNMKLGFTRNVGIAHSHGELVTFLDSDDIILPQKIERCIEKYLSTGADCINSPVISRYHDKQEEISTIVPRHDVISDYLRRRVVWKIIGPVWTRKFLDKIGWFIPGEEIFGTEDYEFHLRAILGRVNMVFLEEPLSVQINLDPALDTVKIRHPDKVEVKVKTKIFSRSMALRDIYHSDQPIGKKIKYYFSIMRYLAATMKSSVTKLSISAFVKVNYYLFHTLLFRRLKSDIRTSAIQ